VQMFGLADPFWQPRFSNNAVLSDAKKASHRRSLRRLYWSASSDSTDKSVGTKMVPIFFSYRWGLGPLFEILDFLIVGSLLLRFPNERSSD
jgi:hypothetical protein